MLPVEALAEGMSVCVKLRICSQVKEARIRKNMTIYSVKAADDTGAMSIIWYNNRFIKNSIRIGGEYMFFGKVTRNRGIWEMTNPVFERPDKAVNMGKILPVYSLSADMTQKIIRGAVAESLKHEQVEYLPMEIRQKYSLAHIKYALKNIHYPDSENDREVARKRLVFEELYLLMLALMSKKGDSRKIKKIPFQDVECRREFIDRLPFELTGAQKRVIDEISEDFASGRLMTRLVQGDVGSGKTAVAATAMYMAVKNGYQSVIMAPTEILATQHYETFSAFFEGTGIKLVLLTGSNKRKKDIYEEIEKGEYDIIIGTHAVIQKNVVYKNIGLVVADEQHRFGVNQRAALSEKGDSPHFLVMTATPIPRTLALILYGDLDISILDELPPGRKPVATYAVGEGMRARINAFLEKNIKNGSQGYVVAPLIEETENSDLKNASEIKDRLSKLFPQFSVGLIHGRMKAAEKDEIMERFAKHEIDILVSTTVIEVGVNVPNSNIMIIENAERFGLSQLHQLRGRVGRGNGQAYCILFSQGGTEITKKRLETMCKSNDGFYISEQDLKLRGPGDFFGTRQHGLPEFKIANLFEDMEILKEAQRAAEKTLNGEFEFSECESQILSDKILNILPENDIIN